MSIMFTFSRHQSKLYFYFNYSTFIISLQPSTGGRIVALNASDLKMKGLKTTVMTAGGSDAQRYVTR